MCKVAGTELTMCSDNNGMDVKNFQLINKWIIVAVIIIGLSSLKKALIDLRCPRRIFNAFNKLFNNDLYVVLNVLWYIKVP